MNKNVCRFLFVLTALCGTWVYAETVIDVRQQWGAHASSSAAPASEGSPRPAQVTSSSTMSQEGVSCGCEVMTPKENLEQATYAFTGVVAEVRAPKKGRREVTLDVDEIYKGSPKPEMKVTIEDSGDRCDLPFESGQPYLVFARWEWGGVFTNRCMGTKLLAKARRDVLGPSEQMKEKLYSRLHNACMGRRDTACCLSSLKAMRANYYVPEPEGGCPDGTIPDRLLCAGSYTWCIPDTAKRSRP